MITLHHLEQSRSQRILWLLEELGVDYQLRRYSRNRKTRLAPDELRQIHPLGSSPVLTDGDRTLAESGVIAEYLARTQGGESWLRSADDGQYWDYLYWMQYAEASAMPPLLVRLIMATIRTAPMPFFIRPVAKGIADKVDKTFTEPQIDKHFSYIEAHLTGHEWFLGTQISLADVMMSFPLEAAVAGGVVSGPDFDHITAWVHRVQARPAYQRAIEAGGEYQYLVK